MKQGQIWYADLNPTKGSEQAGFRPVMIVSGDMLNTHLNIVICCPLTTKIKNYKGNVILEPDELNNLKSRSEVLTFHIRSVSKSRLVKFIGTASREEIIKTKSCLTDILHY